MVKRRYEILLPAEFNDGRLIADACPRCLPDSLSEVISNFGWIRHLKSHLLRRFQQLDIYVTSYPVEVH